MKNVKDGDVIVLAAGTYNLGEDLETDSDKGTVVLYGDPKTPYNVKIRVSGSTGTIQSGHGGHLKLVGLDISNEWIGVYANNSRMDVLFCNIHDCRDRGVYSSNDSYIFIENCVVRDNNVSGFYIRCKVDIKNCLVKGNGHGVYMSDGGKATVSGCEIVQNNDGIVINASDSFATVTNCNIKDNKSTGVRMYSNAGGEFRNNTLSGNKDGNWSVDSSCKVTRVGNTPNQ